MADEHVDVAYVVSRWGEPTETFVRREVGAVLEAGGTVRVLSLKRPRPTELDVPVVHLGLARTAVRAITTIVRHPRRALRTLGRVATASSPRNITPRAAACLIGLAWASDDVVDADVVQAHFGWVAATAAWSEASMNQRPYSVVMHAFELHTRRFLDRFTAVPLRDATRVFTISERDAQLVRSRWGIDARVRRMGVTDDWLTPRSGLPRDPWLVVAVGSLVPKKGHEHLLRALTLCDPRWHLVIVGEGSERTRLESMIEHLDLERRVELAGSLPEREVRALVEAANAFALAAVVAPDGDRDGIPVALMEAMACGTPVLTTRVGAIDELVEGCGLLVEPADVDALATALDSLRDPALRSVLAARGRARVSADFRASAGGEQVLALARGHEG